MAGHSGQKRIAARVLLSASAFPEIPPDRWQLQNLTAIAAGEKNRLHKALTDAGIRLSVVVSDLYGKSSKAMIQGLLN
jgi:hypothetical protein